MLLLEKLLDNLSREQTIEIVNKLKNKVYNANIISNRNDYE